MTNFAAYMIKSWQLFLRFKFHMGLFFFMSGLLLGACQTEERPEGVLSQEELAKLMVEIYLAEGRMSNLNIVKDSAMKYFIPFEEKLKAKHQISDSTIRITYQYYISHPHELEKIYDSVIDTLSLREQKQKTIPVVN
jgi:cAMP phosphodiesterase